MIKKWRGKAAIRNNFILGEEMKMGVSMGILQTLEGVVAKEFLKESEKAKMSKETIKKCLDLVKDIKIK
ncbi:hypothetical protein LI064_02930 [Clostridium perfringens]|uniref:hypothetical protein n=1 Tax=Clostridium perfringens TaxID=1502 RepID=UPI0022487265|nr:hypothetical protein [Clostridium perfringens]MCX0353477.1 hypothetical protein [Clostridium perfringens]